MINTFDEIIIVLGVSLSSGAILAFVALAVVDTFKKQREP